MSNKDFYIESSDGFANKVSCGNINMTLIAEFSRIDDIFVALSLLEDLKKRLIAYYECKPITTYPINGKINPATFDIPDILRSKLAVRAESENCSPDTLLVYVLSHYLSGTIK